MMAAMQEELIIKTSMIWLGPNRGWFLATYKEDDVEYEGWIFKRGVEF